MAEGLTDATKIGIAAVAVGGILALVKGTPGQGTDPNAVPESVTWSGEKDFRVKIKVPDSYITEFTSSYNSELQRLGGIIFPYTPSISFDTSANYSNMAPMHSNYTYYSYRNSQVGAISISGRFSVENDVDAVIYLSTVHLLKSLTKMRFGTDSDAGAPPPVCRLFAYGDYMMNNVPVVVSSFKQDFPTEVDYYRLNSREYIHPFGQNFVPIMSSLSLTLLPMYSRYEQTGFGVDSFLKSNALRKGGFL